MTEDDYKIELAQRKVEVATLLALLAQGQGLMNDLALACDGAVLNGEPYPDALNDRVRSWCHANWAAPIAEILPPEKRYLQGQTMHWNGIPVVVDGIAKVEPAGNWSLIDGTADDSRGAPSEPYPQQAT